MQDKLETKVTAIYWPEERELTLFKRCVWVTMGKTEMPSLPPSSKLLSALLNARHSPVRILNFAFLVENVPSNISTHFARHVHAQPYISSLRNDWQDKIDGDEAPRTTPVHMIFYCNAEELMNVANKRLCGKASEKTQQVAQLMCSEAARVCPEIAQYLVPNCVWHGGVCHEPESCGRCIRG